MEGLVMLEALREKFSGKKVMLTGHTGFKGAWFLLLLNDLGAETTGFSLEAEKGSLYSRIEGDKYCRSIIGDISHLSQLKQAVELVSPDYVFHLAAQSLVLPAYRDPVTTYESNVMGTVNLLEALKGVSKKVAATIITTDKVYTNDERGLPFKEGQALGGGDPYSNSKACAEMVVQSYQDTIFPRSKATEHNVLLATARSGNVIGGGDHCEHRLVPDIVRSIESNTELTLRNPQAVRPWQHVMDTLEGYLMLASKLYDFPEQVARSYNFGPDENQVKTVGQLVEEAFKVYGQDKSVGIQSAEPHEAGLLLLDNSMAARDLAWSPRCPVEESIRKTILWYRNCRDLKAESIVDFTLSQIRDHFRIPVEQ